MLPDAVANALSTARIGSLRTLAVDVDEQNGDTIDSAGDKLALPDLIKLDHCPPIAHLASSR